VKTPVKILNKKELMNLAGDETRAEKKTHDSCAGFRY